MLETVLQYGTGKAASLGQFAAGKTGTTSNYGDAWFVGWDSKYTVAVWVGYPNKLIPMTTAFNGQPVLGFIGSFYAYEGLDLLLEAVPLLSRRIPDFLILLVGGGPDEERLRGIARSLGIERFVRVTGRVPHQDVAHYYGVADVLVFPRRRMRLTELVTPLKPLEAMAQGKLLIASDVGGHREAESHQHPGRVRLDRGVDEVAELREGDHLLDSLIDLP